MLMTGKGAMRKAEWCSTKLPCLKCTDSRCQSLGSVVRVLLISLVSEPRAVRWCIQYIVQYHSSWLAFVSIAALCSGTCIALCNMQHACMMITYPLCFQGCADGTYCVFYRHALVLTGISQVCCLQHQRLRADSMPASAPSGNLSLAATLPHPLC